MILDMIHIVIATFNTYIFIRFFGRRHSAFIVLIINLLHLSYLHVNRMINKYGNWDLSVDVFYMMTICKFSSIAFAYEDGAKDDEKIPSGYWKSK